MRSGRSLVRWYLNGIILADLLGEILGEWTDNADEVDDDDEIIVLS